MKITVVKPGFELVTPLCEFDASDMIEHLERCGRVCYKSEDKITPDSAERFIRAIVKSGHLSVIEHASVTVKFIGDRSMSHQLVRHRIAAFSQESQRYCDYGRLGLQVICPPTIAEIEPGAYECTGARRDSCESCRYWLACFSSHTPVLTIPNRGLLWLDRIASAYAYYLELREDGVPPEDARSVLPNAIKTEVVTTFNMRQWRHVFDERALNKHAQWQIREIMQDILVRLASLFPCIFQDQMDRLVDMRAEESK